MLKGSYTGNLSTSFILKGRLSLGLDLSGAVDSRDVNELMEMMKDRQVRLTVEEVA
jgi:hypothetical protein